MSDFTDKTVIVTGGNGGIGKEVAGLFANLGAQVYIIGRNEQTLKKTVDELSSEREQVRYKMLDVKNVQDCGKVVNEIAAEAGRLDVLVNAAGKYIELSTDETEQKDFDDLFDINVRGTYFMCKYARPHLAQTEGAIVNIGSTAGSIAFPEASLYCATKGALNMITKSLAIDFAKDGIRVNIVCPDMVKTKMLDVGFLHSGIKDRDEYDLLGLGQYPQAEEKRRFILPEEVAECVVFLASNEKAASITGASVTLDFGLTAGSF